MNKIFRVIWSEAVQAWIAVSELSKSHQKSRSVSLSSAQSAVIFPLKFFKLSLLSFAFASTGAYAADAVPEAALSLEKSPVLYDRILIGGPDAEKLGERLKTAKEKLDKAKADLEEAKGKSSTIPVKLKRALTEAETTYAQAVIAAKSWMEGTDQAKTVVSTQDLGRLLKANQIEYVSINSKTTTANALNDGAQGEDSIAIGPKATVAKEGKGGISIGLAAAIDPGKYPIETTFKNNRHTVNETKSVENVADNIVIGNEASSQYGSNNISIGKGAGQKYIIDVDSIKVKDTKGLSIENIRDASNTIAIGNEATTYDKGSIAIGFNAGKDSKFINVKNMAPAVTSALNSILIGSYTQLKSTDLGLAEPNKGYTLDDSIAIGSDATIDSNGPGSIALGAKAIAGGVGNESSGIAIGNEAKAKSISISLKPNSTTEYEA